MPSGNKNVDVVIGQHVVHGGRADSIGGILHVSTPALQYGNSLLFPVLGASDIGDRNITITLEGRVLAGKVGLCALRADGTFLKESHHRAGATMLRLRLIDGKASECASIVLRNLAPQGQVSELIVTRIFAETTHAVEVLSAVAPRTLRDVTLAPFHPDADRSDNFEAGGIDVTEKCNLECVMCHFNGPKATKKAGALSPEMIERYLNQLPSGEQIWFAGTGDLLMDARAITYIRRARDLGLHPCVLTNGQLLTPELMDNMLEAGVRFIQMSVDAHTAHQYEKIRRGAKFDKILDACAYLRQKKSDYKDLSVQINVTLFRNTFDKQDAMIAFWKGKVDQINFNAEYYNTFLFRNTFHFPEKRNNCRIKLYLLPTGHLAPCCAMQVYQHEKDASWLPHIDQMTLQDAYDYLCDLYENPDSPFANLCQQCDWWILYADAKDGATPYLRCVPLAP
ncbi:radical SAM protein [Azospirillum brasilense]|jgi:Predicted Fe-S oxidoreductases|uniref:radical SAM protein n=1 Tax=Azospirillum brasilense TaxID=192 RepID=UPI001EDBBE3A|nr:radical SAM protein [Azospirillum brasilense]UKJ78128.1 radical SAM protein [Azospirillum brasilense]